MADEIKMVVVNGVRYRPEHAPRTETEADETPAEVEHKMRAPRKRSAKK